MISTISRQELQAGINTDRKLGLPHDLVLSLPSLHLSPYRFPSTSNPWCQHLSDSTRRTLPQLETTDSGDGQSKSNTFFQHCQAILNPSLKRDPDPETEEPEHRKLGTPWTPARSGEASDLGNMSPVAGDLAAEAKDQAESSTGFDTDTENARASLEKCPEKGGAGAPAHLEPLYSVIPRRQRALIVAIVSSAGLCSPLATSIYFPAMTSIATDLKVEVSQINLSITTCM